MVLDTLDVQVRTAGVHLDGNLAIPEGATGLVIFAHGSGSSRFSPRNRLVASELQRNGLATFLIDLFTPDEEQADNRTGELRFDIGLLGERVAGTVQWCTRHPRTGDLKIGLFGASTGAAAALVAAANMRDEIWAVVSRGGRPDLAGTDVLARVQCPTLLVTGGDDEAVIALNRQAFEVLNCEKRLEVVPGATHLFEEPGALETVARLATDWFGRYLSVRRQRRVA